MSEELTIRGLILLASISKNQGGFLEISKIIPEISHEKHLELIGEIGNKIENNKNISKDTGFVNFLINYYTFLGENFHHDLVLELYARISVNTSLFFIILKRPEPNEFTVIAAHSFSYFHSSFEEYFERFKNTPKHQRHAGK